LLAAGDRRSRRVIGVLKRSIASSSLAITCSQRYSLST
jgi:hypothetical protein